MENLRRATRCLAAYLMVYSFIFVMALGAVVGYTMQMLYVSTSSMQNLRIEEFNLKDLRNENNRAVYKEHGDGITVIALPEFWLCTGIAWWWCMIFKCIASYYLFKGTTTEVMPLKDRLVLCEVRWRRFILVALTLQFSLLFWFICYNSDSPDVMALIANNFYFFHRFLPFLVLLDVSTVLLANLYINTIKTSADTDSNALKGLISSTVFTEIVMPG